MAEVNKGGRPRLPDHVRRSVILTMRVTTAERDLLQASAGRAGQTLTEYVREWSVRQATIERGQLDHPTCGDAWHMYAYRMDQPDGRARALPPQCPSCDDASPPRVTRLDDFGHAVEFYD